MAGEDWICTVPKVVLINTQFEIREREWLGTEVIAITVIVYGSTVLNATPCFVERQVQNQLLEEPEQESK